MNTRTAQTARNSADAVDAAGVLLRGLIDYAGSFPPASLPMTAAIANYDAYLRSEWRWILGSFVICVARLGEFEEAFTRLPNTPLETNSANWRLSALLASDVAFDAGRIREFNARTATRGSGRSTAIESVEMKVASGDEIKQASAIIPSEFSAYFEFPPANAAECIAALAKCNRRAKIRTGGETADKFPSAASVIEFIRLCVAADVPFKATAGLHHPLRSIHRLTYQPESPSGIMHGFLNVFLAAAFLRAGMEPDVAVKLLEEQADGAFHFERDGVGWRGHRLSRHQIDGARRDFAISFGSCSFNEPIDDLRLLRLL